MDTLSRGWVSVLTKRVLFFQILYVMMESISRQEKGRPKSSLTFSIDKIIGKIDKEELPKETADNKDVSALSVEKVEKRSFQPVKGASSPFQMEMLTQNEHYSQVTSAMKTEMQKRQLTSYFARDVLDVNMNAVPYLHPAFVLGRMCSDEYKAQIFQNLSALHQHWPSFHKDAFYSFDLLNPQDLKAFSVQTSPHEHNAQSIDKLKSMSDHTKRVSHLSKGQSMEVNMKASKHESLNAISQEDSNPTETDNTPSPGRKVAGKSQKSFSCPECGKLFNAHYNLTRHMPVHTGR